MPQAVESTSNGRRKGREMTNQEGKMQHLQQYLLKELWLFSSVGGRMGLEAGKRKAGEGMRERELPKPPCLPSQASTAQPGQFKGCFWRALGIKMKNFSILQPGCDSKESYTASGLARQTLSTHIFVFLLILCKFVKSRAF